MEFSSLIFMFLFLPVFLFLFFILRPVARNSFLLMTSIVFYYWGEGRFTLLLLVSITVNYLFCRLLERVNQRGWQRVILALGLLFNLGTLVYYKYYGFILANSGTSPLAEPIHMPVGISFFTFQALSAILDIYRKTVTMDRNPISFGVYMTLFPKLITGPITPYSQLKPQLESPVSITLDHLIAGFQRFIIGLGKKVLLADTLARTANAIFAIPGQEQTAALAWLGIVCFTLQIYFDFSGYTDMALGLARMMGFTLPENFNYPYIATSIKEFWQRWHISLTHWFRDYLFLTIAYAVSRKIKAPRLWGIKAENWAYFSGALITFFLCGLWHGANWTYIVWGSYYGVWLVIEHAGLGKKMKRKWPLPLRWLYCMGVVMIGWVFFRSASITDAFLYLKAMAGFSHAGGVRYYVALYLNPEVITFLILGIIGATPLFPQIRQRWQSRHKLLAQQPPTSGKKNLPYLLYLPLANLSYQLYLTLILLASTMVLAGGTFNPFIYFGF